jgi:hypothetical protein
MDHVTKQQLILISLLVAIVTAVSTSVATVSLLGDSGSPQQTIYKVIERSIEKVADIPTVKNIVSNDTKKIETTIITPSDIAEKKSLSMVRVYEKVGEVKQFVALGIAVGNKNAVLASSLQGPHTEGAQYIAVTNDNREISAKYEKGDVAGGFTVFTLQYDDKEKNKVPAMILKSISGMKLGSNVVSLGGKESGNVISTGIVTELRATDVTASTTKNILVTDMNLTTGISGLLLFDTSGNLVAFEKGFEQGVADPLFINAKVVEEGIKEFL